MCNDWPNLVSGGLAPPAPPSAARATPRGPADVTRCTRGGRLAGVLLEGRIERCVHSSPDPDSVPVMARVPVTTGTPRALAVVAGSTGLPVATAYPTLYASSSSLRSIEKVGPKVREVSWWVRCTDERYDDAPAAREIARDRHLPGSDGQCLAVRQRWWQRRLTCITAVKLPAGARRRIATGTRLHGPCRVATPPARRTALFATNRKAQAVIGRQAKNRATGPAARGRMTPTAMKGARKRVSRHAPPQPSLEACSRGRKTPKMSEFQKRKSIAKMS